MIEVPSASAAQCGEWESRLRGMCESLGWPAPSVAIDRHQSGASLAFTAARDQLFTATEVNEWAWQGIAHGPTAPALPNAPGHPATWDVASALQTLRLLGASEANPRAMALCQAAAERHLPVLMDDDALSVGAGEGSQGWPIAGLPISPDDVDWSAVSDIPTVLVTGSNGKTTTVRLLAAMFGESGRRAGFNCTDGVFVDGKQIERGDFSGPAGARRVLRDPRVQAAVLETARGAILRRGLAVSRADGAVVTNVSADHFGEYGIHDLPRLADAKLVLARAIGSDGILVLNADDPTLASKSASLSCPLAWFALDHENPRLQAHRQRGGSTCGVSDGQLLLHVGGSTSSLGSVDDMPLTLGGTADYNIANLTGAALLAGCLGLPVAAIAGVLARFGASRRDNPGRLERWELTGASVLVDYAHNPEGLAGLLRVASAIRLKRGGRLGLLLGQAGNRDDLAIRQLARTAAGFGLDHVVLKDLQGYMRGRLQGEVPALLSSELAASGVDPASIVTVLDEVEAARAMLAWSMPGDVVVLPVHNLDARSALVEWLGRQE